jgi:hypothetical protein
MLLAAMKYPTRSGAPCQGPSVGGIEDSAFQPCRFSPEEVIAELSIFGVRYEGGRDLTSSGFDDPETRTVLVIGGGIKLVVHIAMTGSAERFRHELSSLVANSSPSRRPIHSSGA